MYNTDIIDNFYYDCLYYSALDNIVNHSYKIQPSSFVAPQIIPYCIRRSEMNNNLDEILGLEKISFTLEQLKNKNVTSKDLLNWSTAIDLVEHYQAFLDNNSVDQSWNAQIYYNCSSIQRFGQHCQYTFDLTSDEHQEIVFNDIVKQTFLVKNNINEGFRPNDYTNGTCYAHLKCDEENATSPFLCLDWREICNQNIDCLHMYNTSADEQYSCFELELNECSENEYRCHNGAQCIPDVFFRDDEWNPDCVDGSDESTFAVQTYSFLCFQDPLFRCEEHISIHALAYFPCGDGQSSVGLVPTDFDTCTNRRGTIITQAMISYNSHPQLSYECWSAFLCIHPLKLFNVLDCIHICPTISWCVNQVQKFCPKLFFFPNYSIYFGHVRYLYSSNITEEFEEKFQPLYICYDDRLCDFPFSAIRINGTLCSRYEEFHISYIDWISLTTGVTYKFNSCRPRWDLGNYCEQTPSVLFRCNSSSSSSKCLSNHRLVDGHRDCYNNNDELVNNSCIITGSKYRVHCKSENKCISPLLVLDGKGDCLELTDENLQLIVGETTSYISFPSVCDGFFDKVLQLDNGEKETDETNCDQWPCDNIYSRCNDYWDCSDGRDEVNCQSTSRQCPANEHQCISPNTYEPICLPLSKIGNGEIDCLGSYDERKYCREIEPYNKDWRYRCINSSNCVSAQDICIFYQCPDDKDKAKLCLNILKVVNCEDDIWTNLCRLKDEKKSNAPVYFSFGMHPNIHSRTNTLLLPYTSTEKPMIISKNRIALLHQIDFRQSWLCNRGILVRAGNRNDERCLCPPPYYGHHCEYQSQRISLTVQFRKEALLDSWQRIFRFLVLLIDHEEQEIYSSDQILYASNRQCSPKFNVYLLYRSQPKDGSKNYNIRIDAYTVDKIAYYASWYVSIPFQFLPVNRLAVQLTIRAKTKTGCSRKCSGHGQCFRYMNTLEEFCRCDMGWSGSQCDISVSGKCMCSSDSFCAGFNKNRSICVCPLSKFGPRCFLTFNSCLADTCLHGGLCIPQDERISLSNSTCLCPQGFTGARCEIPKTSIHISFDKMIPIPDSILMHMINVHENQNPTRITMMKKILLHENSAIIYTFNVFHIVFVEIQYQYYLAYVGEIHKPNSVIKTELKSHHRCSSIYELFYIDIAKSNLLKRVKYYHIPCQDRSELSCFYDDIYLCLCMPDRFANCLPFVHNITYDCKDNVHYCENGGKCFQDQLNCPSAIECVCSECFFGLKCQLSTTGLGLSLDAILGYQIQPRVGLSNQSSIALKTSIGMVTIMFVLGFIGAILLMITFQAKKDREIGCGLYLFASAFITLITMISLLLRFWLLVFSQMIPITNHSFLLIQCRSMDCFIRIFLAINNWLHASVAVERVFTIIKGITFDKKKSRQVARWIIVSITLFSICTALHEPIHRRLIDDEQEQRIWCIVTYSPSVEVFNLIINMFHLLIPCAINLIAALFIIIVTARQRTTLHTNESYKQHLYKKFCEHKHLILSSLMIVLLSMPRIIMSFVSGCMKSSRNPWLFLIGYFVSFIPSLLPFFVFVLPSTKYQEQFSTSFHKIQTKLRNCFTTVA